MSQVKVRRAVAGDAALVRDLVHAAYAKWVPVIGREPRPMQADYGHAIEAHLVELLEVDGVVVGLVEMIRQPDHLWIENVCVLPAYQGQGLGKRLMALAEARAAGLGELRLLTNGAFKANIALYQSLGYRIDREEPYLDGTTVYMSKSIAKEEG